MRSVVPILLALIACSPLSVHGRRAAGQRHLRRAGSKSSASVHASSRHYSRDIWAVIRKIDKVDYFSCNVSALATRKPAKGDRLQRGEILHSAIGKPDNGLSKDSTRVWLWQECSLIVDFNDKTERLVFGNDKVQAHHCGLLLTDASCSTQGDLAIINLNTGKYIWRVQSSIFTPEVDTFLVQGDGNAVLLQEGAQLLWSAKVSSWFYYYRYGQFQFDLYVREDVHSLQCDVGVLQSSYHQVRIGDVLSPGQVLRAGAALKVGEGEGVELRMQGDCNLVVYRGGKAVFATNTRGKGTEGECALIITGDGCDTQGDLAIVDSASGQYIWRVPTSLMDPGADTLRLQGDGNAVLFQQGGAIAWSAGSADLDSPDDDGTFGNGRKTAALQAAIEGAVHRCDPQALAKRPAARGDTLWDSEVLAMGQYLRSGGDSQASLTVQDDCNAVETRQRGEINWKTDTRGKAQKCALVITGEECDRAGDLALVDMVSGAYLWSIDTSYMRPTARALTVSDAYLALFQQATLDDVWLSDDKTRTNPDGSTRLPPPEGYPEPMSVKAFDYWGESQDG